MSDVRHIEEDADSGDDADDMRHTEKKARLTDPLVVPRGKIRVAKYHTGRPLPVTPDYTNVLIHVSGQTIGGGLSPFVLRNESGQLLENVWQFAKVYAKVEAQTAKLGRYSSTVIWTHPAEVHVEGDHILPAYWEWRNKGMNNRYAVRYPAGFHGRHKCLFSIAPGAVPDGGFQRLNYIQARKRIYCGEYARLAPREAHFLRLQAMLNSGQNIQICEVDGPDVTLSHPPYDRISATDPGLDIDESAIRLLVNDPIRPFGHGFVIAALLLGGAQWMLE